MIELIKNWRFVKWDYIIVWYLLRLDNVFLVPSQNYVRPIIKRPLIKLYNLIMTYKYFIASLNEII